MHSKYWATLFVSRQRPVMKTVTKAEESTLEMRRLLLKIENKLPDVAAVSTDLVASLERSQGTTVQGSLEWVGPAPSAVPGIAAQIPSLRWSGLHRRR